MHLMSSGCFGCIAVCCLSHRWFGKICLDETHVGMLDCILISNLEFANDNFAINVQDDVVINHFDCPCADCDVDIFEMFIVDRSMLLMMT